MLFVTGVRSDPAQPGERPAGRVGASGRARTARLLGGGARQQGARRAGGRGGRHPLVDVEDGAQKREQARVCSCARGRSHLRTRRRNTALQADMVVVRKLLGCSGGRAWRSDSRARRRGVMHFSGPLLGLVRLQVRVVWRGRPLPPVLPVPLGTGNDMARAMGWGGRVRTKHLASVLERAKTCRPAEVDYWQASTRLSLRSDASGNSAPSVETPS